MANSFWQRLIHQSLFQFSIGKRVFAPSLFPTIVFLLLLPTLLRLGVWQLDRAQEKRDIQANLIEKSAIDAISLEEALKQNNPDQASVVFLGQPLTQEFLVIDNQKQGRQLGYEILGLYQAEDYTQPILISRGWLPRKDFYQKVPDIPEFADPIIKGNLYLSKGANQVVASNAQWEQFDNKHLIGQFDMQTIEEKVAQMGYHIAPFVVRQKPEEESPFVRNWPIIASPPEKHTAYALQWFAMALALVIIFVVVNTKRLKFSASKEEI